MRGTQRLSEELRSRHVDPADAITYAIDQPAPIDVAEIGTTPRHERGDYLSAEVFA
jgi:hypothetical protein